MPQGLARHSGLQGCQRQVHPVHHDVDAHFAENRFVLGVFDDGNRSRSVKQELGNLADHQVGGIGARESDHSVRPLGARPAQHFGVGTVAEERDNSDILGQ